MWDVDLQACGEQLGLEPLSALVVLGDSGRRWERGLVVKAVERDMPVLAIGRGARFLAHVLGAPAPAATPHGEAVPPVVAPMFLTDEGCVDRVLGAAPSPVSVVHRHRDGFDLPDGATVLAYNRANPARAFRCRRAYGLPFQVEVDAELAARWGMAPPPAATLRAGAAILDMFARLVSHSRSAPHHPTGSAS